MGTLIQKIQRQERYSDHGAADDYPE